MTVKRKNRKNRTSKNRRKTMRGGLFGFFEKKTPEPIVSPQTNRIDSGKPDTHTNALIQKSDAAEKKSTMYRSTDAKLKLASATANVATIGTVVSNIGYGAVAGLTASGIGIPLAGAIAAALLIANKLSNMYLYKLKLYRIMYDAMSILTNCYRLHKLIEKAFEIIKKHLKIHIENKKQNQSEAQINVIEKSLVNRISIDTAIQQHILDKVKEVTVDLLSITKDKVLQELKKDPDIINSHFNTLIDSEIQLRNSQNFKFIGKVQREINRTVYVSDTKSNIIDNLCLINSFFIIIKSQYDFTLQLYEREFGEQWKNILTEIENTEEYINFLIQDQDEIKESIEIAKQEMKTINDAITGIKDTQEKEQQNNLSENNDQVASQSQPFAN